MPAFFVANEFETLINPGHGGKDPGIDIEAPIGTPVLASENGVVAEISSSKAVNDYGVAFVLNVSTIFMPTDIE